MEGEYAPWLPRHLSPRGAAAELHRAAGGDGFQPGHPRVEEVAAYCVPRAHTTATGRYYKAILIPLWSRQKWLNQSSGCDKNQRRSLVAQGCHVVSA